MWVLYLGWIGIWSVGLSGGSKTGEPRENNQQQTQSTCGTGPESNPGHIDGRRSLAVYAVSNIPFLSFQSTASGVQVVRMQIVLALYSVPPSTPKGEFTKWLYSKRSVSETVQRSYQRWQCSYGNVLFTAKWKGDGVCYKDFQGLNLENSRVDKLFSLQLLSILRIEKSW